MRRRHRRAVGRHPPPGPRCARRLAPAPRRRSGVRARVAHRSGPRRGSGRPARRAGCAVALLAVACAHRMSATGLGQCARLARQPRLASTRERRDHRAMASRVAYGGVDLGQLGCTAGISGQAEAIDAPGESLPNTLGGMLLPAPPRTGRFRARGGGSRRASAWRGRRRCLDGAYGQDELLGDLVVGEPTGGERGDLGLAAGQFGGHRVETVDDRELGALTGRAARGRGPQRGARIVRPSETNCRAALTAASIA